MKVFQQSEAINLTGIPATIVINGTGITVTSSGSNPATYTISLDAILNNISNVDAPYPSNKQALVYDIATNTWKNITLSTDHLSDFLIYTPASGEFLRYDGSDWVNDNAFLNDLYDANISSPTDKQIILYDSTTSRWVNINFKNYFSGLWFSNFQQEVNISTLGTWESLTTKSVIIPANTLKFYGNGNDVAGDVLELEATFYTIHTAGFTESMSINLNGATSLVTESIISGSTYYTVLKAKINILTETTQAYLTTEKETNYAPTHRKINQTYLSFDTTVDNKFQVYVQTTSGIPSSIVCNSFTVKINK